MANIVVFFVLDILKLVYCYGKHVQSKILLFLCATILIIMLPYEYANADIVDLTPPAQEQEENPDWLQSRVSGNGLLFCSGKKGQDIVECKNDRVKGVRSDLNRIVLTGWRLIQVLPDEQRGIWYFFFQR